MTALVAGLDPDRFTKAKEDELEKMKQYDVWDVVDYKKGIRPITTKWVLTDKVNAKGEYERSKARLVARGFEQAQSRKNVNKKYAPVMNKTSLRMILSQSRKDVRCWDVTSAFLNGEIDEEVYLLPPAELNLPKGKILRLKKALYGWYRAQFCWWVKLCRILIDLGWNQSDWDTCVFYKEDMILGFHVDDIIVTGDNKKLDDFFTQLSNHLEIKQGPLESYLGISYSVTKDAIRMDMRNYIEELLERFEMKDCRPAKSLPQIRGITLSEKLFDDLVMYSSLIGSLNYLSVMMRIDIVFITKWLSSYQNRPSITHWRIAKELLRYLKATKNATLTIKTDQDDNRIEVYSDADFGSATDRKSTSGWIYMWRGNILSWRSKKQTIITTSTSEAELIAMSEATDGLEWVQMLRREIVGEGSPTDILYTDSQSAMKKIKRGELGGRSKHLDIRAKSIMDREQRGLYTIEYVHTKENVADLLTKRLPTNQLVYLCEKLGLRLNVNEVQEEEKNVSENSQKSRRNLRENYEKSERKLGENYEKSGRKFMEISRKLYADVVKGI
jgi:hypothetical protein